MDLFEDKGLNHSYLSNGTNVNFSELQNSRSVKSLKDELKSSHTTMDESAIIGHKSAHGLKLLGGRYC